MIQELDRKLWEVEFTIVRYFIAEIQDRWSILKKIITIVFALMLGVLLVGCNKNTTDIKTEYAVLIGANSNITADIENVDVLVIDADYFMSDDISKLRINGVNEIYSYLNIGSLENFRTYYDEYVKYTLGEYENWPEERWIDVSQKEWQDFISARVDELSQKGVDGFFIDNTDVYYLYQNEEIYQGIINILKDIKSDDKKVIINGGDTFVKKYFESENENLILDGINQEDVYTKYDFANKTCSINTIEDRQYYTDYLDMAIANGCKAYVLEYATDAKTRREAREYAKKHGYTYYISDDIELN